MERYDLLKEWMRDNRVTFRWTGSKIGITGAGVLRLLRSNRIPVKRHIELIELGFPAELLPKAEDYIPKGKTPLVPVWEQDSKAAD